MKTLSLAQPAEAKPEAGKKRVPMTLAEKQQQRQRLKEVPEDEKKKAMNFLFRFITGYIIKKGFDFKTGPFTYVEMQGKAAEVIGWDCYVAIHKGEWRWPENRKLSTQLIQIAKSKISHIIRDYCEQHSYGTTVFTSQMSPSDIAEMESAASVKDITGSMRDLAFDIALKAVAGNPRFVQYLVLLREMNAYDTIADAMGLEDKREVYRIEREMLKFLANQ